MEKMSSITFPDGSSYEIVDAEARKLIENIDISGGSGECHASNPNLLINGDFQVWQRGNSFTGGNSATTYTADRWHISATNTNYTLSRHDNGLQTSITNNTTGGLYQVLETLLEDGEDYVLSAKINETIHTLNIVAGTTNKGGDTLRYERGSRNGGTYDWIGVIVPSGTNVVQWVKLEKGSVATPFIPRLYGEELVLCHRYYVRVGYLATNNMSIASGMLYGETLFVVGYSLPVPMRTSPTVNVNNFKITNCLHTGGDILISGVTPCATTSKDIHLTFAANTIPSKFVGSIGMLTLRDSSSYLEFDAEIY